ncbi:ATP-dependent nuclease [Clavibacter capsici]|uniref:ATP-dependent nuclease n=1 Tax=Clavibacter capsici TaxID=1874630 RepID=UPI00293E4A8A|nr:AAA family ATPase [Clavibacter capsici]
MRISHVDVNYLLGFQNVHIDIDSNLQLIAGPNNAGKSTLVRLLEVFFSAPSGEDFSELRPLNDYYANLGPRTLSVIQVWFKDLSTDELIQFAPLLRKDGQIWVNIRCSRAGQLSYRASQSVEAAVAHEMYQEVVSRFRFVKIPSVRVGGTGDAGEPESLERLLETLEATLIRSGASRSTALQQKFASKMAPVEELVKGVLADSAQAIAAELPFREQEISIELPDSRHALRGMLESAVIKSKDEIDIPISQRGTGFQSALVLGMLRYVADQEGRHTGSNLMFAIEEPEAFLHPQTQRAMAKVLAKISENAQLLVTTHSPVVVDSFAITQIARLPIQDGGTIHSWSPPSLPAADAGRLTRFCSAANSELVFANAVIFVEGEGDFAFVERLLSRICEGTGGHYALGLTVIDTGGIDTMKHLVQLAEVFDVKSYTLTDKDGLRKNGAKRKLMEILAQRENRPAAPVLDALRAEADVTHSDLEGAVASQIKLNNVLVDFDAFTLSSDLEGLVLDSFGASALAVALGPDGEGAINATEVNRFQDPESGYEAFAAWLGSKGWNCDRKTSNKVSPHLPAAVIDAVFEEDGNPPIALAPLYEWLQGIVREQEQAPV